MLTLVAFLCFLGEPWPSRVGAYAYEICARQDCRVDVGEISTLVDLQQHHLTNLSDPLHPPHSPSPSPSPQSSAAVLC